MHWFLQNNVFSEEGYDRLVEALQARNLSYSIHKIIPLEYKFKNFIPSDYHKHEETIAIGSYAMERVLKNYGICATQIMSHGVLLKAWLTWKNEFLNYQASVVPFFSIENTLNTLNHVKDNEFFFKPFNDNKLVDGEVCTVEEIISWIKYIQINYGGSTKFHDWKMKQEDLFIIGKPIKVFSEFRFWIIKNKIVTSSQYRQNGKLFSSSVVDEDITEYVEKLLKNKNPLRSLYYVMDVCRSEKGIKIVKIQTLNFSGFYSADLGKLVEAIEIYHEG